MKNRVNAVGKKQMNTYLKYGLMMLIFMSVGAALGFAFSYFRFSGDGQGFSGIAEMASLFTRGLAAKLFPVMAVMVVLSILWGELCMKKMKRISNVLKMADDEESDRLEYEEEKVSAWGTVGSNLMMILSIVLISFAYSMDYMDELSKKGLVMLLAAFGCYLIIFLYEGAWQIRMVKLAQKQASEKKGDPTSAKFQRQWVESCDEAEKEIIYQSSFEVYTILNQICPLAAAVAMITHLMWNTGVMAVVMVCFIWLITVVTYCRHAVLKQKQRINR